MKRIFLASSDRDESDWLSDELSDYGKIVRTIDTLDFFVPQWETVNADVVIFMENVIKSEESFNKVIGSIRDDKPATIIMFIYFRDDDGMIDKLQKESVICVSYLDLEPGFVEKRLKNILSEHEQYDTDKINPENQEKEYLDILGQDPLAESHNEGPEIQDKSTSKLYDLIERKKAEIRENKKLRNPTIKLTDDDFDFVITQKQKEKVVVLERIIGTIFIAIGGTDRRTGSSITSLKLSQELAKQGFKTACVERNDPDYSPSIYNLYSGEKSKYVPNGYRINNVDIFPGQYGERWLDEFSSNYDYIVLDMGQLFHRNRPSLFFSDFLRANLHILTTCTTDWDYDRFTGLLAYFQQENLVKKINVLVNLSDDRRFKEIEQTFSKKEKDTFKISFFKAIFSLDLYKNELSSSTLYLELIKGVLPKKNNKKWKLW
jgi:cellulose biosynthesis protein BcsQ